MNKPTLKQIATFSAAGKLSIAVGSAQAQDCTTFINLNLDSTPTFLTSEDGSSSVTPSEVTIYTQAKADMETALLSLTGIPSNRANDVALYYSENLKVANPALGCFGSFVLSEGQDISLFRSGVTPYPVFNADTSILIDQRASAIGVFPIDGTAVKMPTNQVDIAFNFSDALGAEKPSPDSFYLQALSVPADDENGITNVMVSNVVHVTINRTDSPPGTGVGKGGTAEPEPEPDTPTNGKTTT